MKYRLAGIAALILVMTVSVAALSLDTESGKSRVHQHQTAKQADSDCSCDGKALCSHLPLIVIDTGDVKIPGEPIVEGKNKYHYRDVTKAADGSSTVSCSVKVIDAPDSNHHITDEPTLETDGQIRIRGNSSRFFDKKSYLLKTTDDSGTENRDVEMLGMDAHHEWAFHGPYLDKTFIRNYMWYNIAGEIMDYAPNVRFCEIIINGQYQGLYVMTETITNGNPGRLNLSEPENNSQATVSYVLRLDKGSRNSLKNIDTFTRYSLRRNNVIDIVYPGTDSLTPERIEYIKQDFSDFEKSLYSYDYDTEPYAWWNSADLDSFADYFIINEFTCNYDVGGLSTYIYKDIRGKYKMCIWDFNSACDNYAESQTTPQRFQLQYTPWFYMLCKDEKFTERVIDRYRELRETWLSDEYLLQYIDDTVKYLGPSIERNYSVWGYTFEEFLPLDPTERNPENYEDAIEQLKTFIVERGAWMDKNIEILKQYSHESKVKKFNH